MDSKMVVANIYYLAKQKGIGIGKLEKDAHVGAGYFSRFLTQDDNPENANKPLPSCEVLFSVARNLDVTIDKLLTVDYLGLKDAEWSVISFLDNLTALTRRNKLIWKKESENTVLSNEPYGEFERHPLCQVSTEMREDCYGNASPYEKVVYYSSFLEDTASMLGDVYRLDYMGLTFLISKIRSYYRKYPKQYDDYVEFYGIKGNKLLKIAFAMITGLEKNEEVSQKNPYEFTFLELYKAATRSYETNPNGEDIIDMIASYMKSMGFDKK